MKEELKNKKNDWVVCTLGELLTLKNGFAFKSSNYITVGIPVIRIGDINNWIVDETKAKCVLENESYEDYVIKKGDILIAMSGATTGKFGIYESNRKAYQNQRVGNLKPNSNNFLDKKYLFNLLYSLKPKIEKDAYGGAQPNISAGKIHALKTVLAPLPIQKAIVTKIDQLFSSLDSGIADLKKAQEQLKIYRQAVLKKAFEGELTKEWREKQTNLPTADELLKQIKEERQKHYDQQTETWKKAVKDWEEKGKVGKKPSKPKKLKELPPFSLEELNQLPKVHNNGIYVKMGNLCDVVRGGSPRPAGDERYYNGNIPFLKVADLTRSKTKYVKTFNYTIKDAGLHKTRLLQIGTLVISNSGATLGVPKILSIRAAANDGIAAFLGLNKKLIDYLYFYWDSKTIALRAINQGAGQPNLNTDLLKNYPIPYFSIPEQTQIVQQIESRLSVCDKVEQSIVESLEKAKALRQSILKKAFEGKLLSAAEIAECKKAKDYEPASVLLERIKAEKLENAKAKKVKK